MTRRLPRTRRDLRGFLVRAAGVLAVVLVVFGLFSLWQEARRNGNALDDALAQLDRERSTRDRLLVVLDRQADELDSQTAELVKLRRALVAAGIDPAEVLVRRPGRPASSRPPSAAGPPGSSSADPAGPGGNGRAAQPGENGRQSHGDGRSDDRPGEDPPGPDRPRCRVVDPLTGECVLRFDTPADPLVDPLLPASATRARP